MKSPSRLCVCLYVYPPPPINLIMPEPIYVKLVMHFVTYKGLAWRIIVGSMFVIRFIKYSQVATTSNYNTLKITINITYQIKSSKSAY
jgi:hypothetical protein